MPIIGSGRSTHCLRRPSYFFWLPVSSLVRQLWKRNLVKPARPNPAVFPLGHFHAKSDSFGILYIPNMLLGLTSIAVFRFRIGWQRRDPPVLADHLEFTVLAADFLRKFQRIFRVNEQHHAAAIAEYDLESFVGVFDFGYTAWMRSPANMTEDAIFCSNFSGSSALGHTIRVVPSLNQTRK